MQHRTHFLLHREQQFIRDETEAVKLVKRPIPIGTQENTCRYPHNIVTGVFLMPTWLLQLYNLLSCPKSYAPTDHQIYLFYNDQENTKQPQIVTILSILLFLYALDLSGHSRSLLLAAIWIIGVGFSSLLFLYTYFHQSKVIYHHKSFSWSLISGTTHTLIDISVWICLACWACLQCKWTPRYPYLEEVYLTDGHDLEGKDRYNSSMTLTLTTPQLLERLMHLLLPISFACTWTRSLFDWLLRIHLDPSNSALDITSRVSALTNLELLLVCFNFSMSLCISRFYMSSIVPSSSRIDIFMNVIYIAPVGTIITLY